MTIAFAPQRSHRSVRTAERCPEFSQGYAFFAYPWKKNAISIRTSNGVRGILATPSGCAIRQIP
jgi:hypothetical protein